MADSQSPAGSTFRPHSGSGARQVSWFLLPGSPISGLLRRVLSFLRTGWRCLFPASDWLLFRLDCQPKLLRGLRSPRRGPSPAPNRSAGVEPNPRRGRMHLLASVCFYPWRIAVQILRQCRQRDQPEKLGASGKHTFSASHISASLSQKWCSCTPDVDIALPEPAP